MKKIVTLLALIYSVSTLAQPVFVEDFESYNGFGSTLTSTWPATNFKVYVNHGTNGSKGCGSNFNNNHKIDSLTSPDLGSITGGILVDFDARLGTDIVGANPTAGYIPTANDHIWFLSSFDGEPFQLVQEMTNQFTNTNTSFTNFSIPVTGSSTSSLRLKMKVQKAQSPSNSEFYLDLDNFAINLLTPVKNLQNSEYAVSLQPNPSSGTCSLILGEGWGPKTHVEVFNILGTKILEVPVISDKITIDLSDQKAGIYLVKVSEGKFSQVKRLIVK
jgi:hypothetical protein